MASNKCVGSRFTLLFSVFSINYILFEVVKLSSDDTYDIRGIPTYLYNTEFGNFSLDKVSKHSINWNGSKVLTFKRLGRMANLMFEYASVIGIAQKNSLSPRAPRIFSPRGCFSLSARFDHSTIDPRFSKEHEPGYLHFTPESFHMGSDVNQLKSNLQSWKYFGHVDDVIRQEFTFGGNDSSYAKEFLSTVGDARKGHVFVSVHVRRTDFKDYPHLIRMATLDYYIRAMNLFREEYRSVKFVVASDNKTWAQENLTGNKNDTFFTGKDATACQDLAILAHCNHSILSAGSSFGWFGAYLARGHVVYYKGWLKTGGWYNYKFVEEDYYLPWWTHIPA